MSKARYAIALGSNRRHHRYGAPARVLAAARDALDDEGLKVVAAANIMSTAAVGPAGRSFANSAVLVHTKKAPAAVLKLLKKIERGFGRKRGRRWGPRVLDLDIILWSGGIYAGQALAVPHAAFRGRRFVLDPLAAIVPHWRDPVTNLTVRQLRARLVRARPVDRRDPAA